MHLHPHPHRHHLLSPSNLLSLGFPVSPSPAACQASAPKETPRAVADLMRLVLFRNVNQQPTRLTDISKLPSLKGTRTTKAQIIEKAQEKFNYIFGYDLVCLGDLEEEEEEAPKAKGKKAKARRNFIAISIPSQFSFPTQLCHPFAEIVSCWLMFSETIYGIHSFECL